LADAAAQVDRLAGLLGIGDVANRVPEIVDDLRRRYPAAGSANIVNCLVTVYCPAVNRITGQGEAEKQARLACCCGLIMHASGP